MKRFQQLKLTTFVSFLSHSFLHNDETFYFFGSSYLSLSFWNLAVMILYYVIVTLTLFCLCIILLYQQLIYTLDVRIQQRNGRKTLTTLQGLPKEFDQKRLLKHFKKDFACNGNIVDDEEMGEVIQLQGDQRTKIHDFLIQQKIATKAQVKVHGF
ncbi:Eukaryotic translation initiation factor eIF-1, variant 2 [Entomophthora muscae]|uniref:Eukaryotic translation initiation factor eIF-1, variant 2 n=1 Tax=Entomophthora muscae TaxID=34485 RepID=A0ACC2RWX3_9FUNG|nr:Eukaryotic translation initiation factor eIF-1, variant 2 [Entomophthora muscae]